MRQVPTPWAVLAVLLAACGTAPSAPEAGPAAAAATDTGPVEPVYPSTVGPDRAETWTPSPGINHLVYPSDEGAIRLSGPGVVLDLAGITLVGHAADDPRDE